VAGATARLGGGANPLLGRPNAAGAGAEGGDGLPKCFLGSAEPNTAPTDVVLTSPIALVVRRPEGRPPREAESDVCLWGGAGGPPPGLVAAIGAGGAKVALERDGGGGGGDAAAVLAPNWCKPCFERLAAAAATLPKPGTGRSPA